MSEFPRMFYSLDFLCYWPLPPLLPQPALQSLWNGAPSRASYFSHYPIFSLCRLTLYPLLKCSCFLPPLRFCCFLITLWFVSQKSGMKITDCSPFFGVLGVGEYWICLPLVYLFIFLVRKTIALKVYRLYKGMARHFNSINAMYMKIVILSVMYWTI